jgi:hypothetical protein
LLLTLSTECGFYKLLLLLLLLPETFIDVLSAASTARTLFNANFFRQHRYTSCARTIIETVDHRRRLLEGGTDLTRGKRRQAQPKG